MKSERMFLDDLWRDMAGLPEMADRTMPSLEVLRETEWSTEFERMMRDALIVGAFRYGRLGEEGKPDYDRLEAMERRVREYQRSGNIECLVDIANFALLEYCEGKHPNRHIDTGGRIDHVGVRSV
jgi:hypothetical protein